MAIRHGLIMDYSNYTQYHFYGNVYKCSFNDNRRLSWVTPDGFKSHISIFQVDNNVEYIEYKLEKLLEDPIFLGEILDYHLSSENYEFDGFDSW